MCCQDNRKRSISQTSTKDQRLSVNNKNQFLNAKVVIVGDQAVGKSSLAARICDQHFQDQYQLTLGGLYYQHNIKNSNGEQVKIHLWDTAGEENFRSMLSMYYQGAKAIIVVFDITREQTFKSVSEYWMEELEQKVQKDNLIMLLVGNKCDLEGDREVTKNQILKFSQQHDLAYFEASSKSGEGTQKMLEYLADRLVSKKKS